MQPELDHLFIWTSVGAPEADLLVRFGLTEGAPNTHPGQGTACRRFFFRNAYLELLWVHDAAEVQSNAVRPLHLWERWSHRADGACPFGFIFRPASRSNRPLPCATWEYRPPYLPEPLSIQVAKNADVLSEPMLFLLPLAGRPDSYAADKRQPLDHAASLSQISRIELTDPRTAESSPELEAVSGAGLVRLRNGSEHLVELGFDGERQAHHADLRPALPLILRW